MLELLLGFSSFLNNYDLIVVLGIFDSSKNSLRDGIVGSFVSVIMTIFIFFLASMNNYIQ